MRSKLVDLDVVVDEPNGDAMLATRVVRELSGHFFVPDYQRGYRWGRPEVERLLDDVAAARGKDYFLQPIVVKRIQDGKWELIDGQQRLTTLFLILQYIHRNGLPKAQPRYSLEYQTRPASQVYLCELNEEDRESPRVLMHPSLLERMGHDHAYEIRRSDQGQSGPVGRWTTAPSTPVSGRPSRRYRVGWE